MRIDLRDRRGRKGVKLLRGEDRVREGVRRGRGVAVCSPENEESLASGGGWSSSKPSGLGALRLGFLG